MDLLSEKSFIFPPMYLFIEATLLTKKTQTPVSDQNTFLLGSSLTVLIEAIWKT